MKSMFLAFLFIPLLGITQENTEPIIDFPDVEAQFPGGAVELHRYIINIIHYSDLIDMEPPSRIYCSFVVEKDGTLTDVEIMGPNDTIWDESYLELIQGMPKWTPAQVNGKAVRSRYRFPILISYH